MSKLVTYFSYSGVTKRKADLKEKIIHLFATSSSTRIEGSIKELKESYPDMNIADGKRI
ncbi:MAG: hypothetical protein E7307_07435 [Butyrivibrio sp.]|nr:hypothetical protein [Butyrivibrio sp.]